MKLFNTGNINVDEDWLIFYFSGSLLLSILSLSIVVLFIVHIRKKQRFEKEKRIMNEKFKLELIKSEMDIREQYTQHIARELHDNIGQLATKLVTYQSYLNSILPEDTQIILKDGEEMIKHLVTEIKRLSSDFNGSSIINDGLSMAIMNDIDRLQRYSKINFETDISNEDINLDNEKSTVVFRMYQEIINNAIKHAEASKITVRLNPCKERYCLSIEDNGVGFNKYFVKRGSGLRNIEDRCALLGAKLEIDSKSNEGTYIHIMI